MCWLLNYFLDNTWLHHIGERSLKQWKFYPRRHNLCLNQWPINYVIYSYSKHNWFWNWGWMWNGSSHYYVLTISPELLFFHSLQLCCFGDFSSQRRKASARGHGQRFMNWNAMCPLRTFHGFEPIDPPKKMVVGAGVCVSLSWKLKWSQRHWDPFS